jgi:ABC-type nitrate/sulfonate/bicarbonate transport system substrate-binding protein
MIERLSLGRAVRRTGDVWPGAPGCSLSATADLVARNPELVQRVVNAYVRAARFVDENLDETAAISAPYIGLHADTIRRALRVNRPYVDAIRSRETMGKVLSLMQRLGYVDKIPHGFANLRFLDRAQAGFGASERRA